MAAGCCPSCFVALEGLYLQPTGMICMELVSADILCISSLDAFVYVRGTYLIYVAASHIADCGIQPTTFDVRVHGLNCCAT